MKKKTITTAALSLVSGYLATKLMEKASALFYDLAPKKIRQKEELVSLGSPARLAAQKAASVFGKTLSEEEADTAGNIVHIGIGMCMAPMYAVIKNTTKMSPLTVGLITGVTISCILDEGLTPTLGLSAPNKDYPWQTHLRGLAAHLVYGFTIACIYEGLNRVLFKEKL